MARWTPITAYMAVNMTFWTLMFWGKPNFYMKNRKNATIINLRLLSKLVRINVHMYMYITTTHTMYNTCKLAKLDNVSGIHDYLGILVNMTLRTIIYTTYTYNNYD